MKLSNKATEKWKTIQNVKCKRTWRDQNQKSFLHLKKCNSFRYRLIFCDDITIDFGLN